jgi:signal transduction histidine kinase
VWVGLLLLVVLIGLAIVSRPQVIAGTVLIQKAQIAALAPGAPIARNVDLPHNWDAERPAYSGVWSYTLDVPATLASSGASGTSNTLALHIPRVGARFRVWLAGQLIHSEYWDTPGYVDTSVQPFFMGLPPALATRIAEPGMLVIEVKGQALRKSGLSYVMLGEESAVRARHERVMMWQVTGTWAVAACSLMVAVMCFLIWHQGADKVFALLAIASGAWALRLALTPAVQPFMPFELWFFLHKLTFTVYCGFLYLFLWHVFDFKQQLARRIAMLMVGIAPFWLAATVLTQWYDLYRIWTGLIAIVATLSLVQMFMRARWGLDDSQRLMFVVALATLIAGLRDFAVVQLGVLGDADIRWMTLGSLVFISTLVWVMVQRTSVYMRQMDDLNHALEERVAEREVQLQQAFESLREAERKQVLEAERSRLTRDMHDGLGSQLVQTLNLVRAQSSTAHNPQIEAMLSHALEELRMTLDSLEPMEGDLPAILGTLRQRISPALAAAHIELDWQVQEVPAVAVNGQSMESRSVMHLFRALQEIFANIIKHSRATRVEVLTRVNTSGEVVLQVSDNGVGFGTGSREGGRGMDNLRARASALGAKLVLDEHSKLGGAGVSLHFAALA